MAIELQVYVWSTKASGVLGDCPRFGRPKPLASLVTVQGLVDQSLWHPWWLSKVWSTKASGVLGDCPRLGRPKPLVSMVTVQGLVVQSLWCPWWLSKVWSSKASGVLGDCPRFGRPKPLASLVTVQGLVDQSLWRPWWLSKATSILSLFFSSTCWIDTSLFRDKPWSCSRFSADTRWILHYRIYKHTP